MIPVRSHKSHCVGTRFQFHFCTSCNLSGSRLDFDISFTAPVTQTPTSGSRSSQHGGVFPACLAHDCRSWIKRRGSHEASGGRPRVMNRLWPARGFTLHLHFKPGRTVWFRAGGGFNKPPHCKLNKQKAYCSSDHTLKK